MSEKGYPLKRMGATSKQRMDLWRQAQSEAKGKKPYAEERDKIYADLLKSKNLKSKPRI